MVEIVQNQQSYEEVYDQNQNHSNNEEEDSVYEQELMLDENDEIELYASQQPSHQKSFLELKSKEILQIQDQKDSSDFLIGQLSQSKFIQTQQNLFQNHQVSQTQAVRNFLQSKYSHFNQKVLIKMLHNMLISQSNPKTKTELKFQPQNYEQSGTMNEPKERKDLQSLKRIKKTAKIFVEHGYGINVARQFCEQGQKIQPNPYNNMILKIIKQSWKAVQSQMQKIKKSFKNMTAQKFNQIKTPLVNARNWMDQQYLDIFYQNIAYIYGFQTEKPTPKNYEDFYNYVMKAALNRKNSVKKGFYKKKNIIQNQQDNESSEEVKPSKKQKFYDQNYKHLTKFVKNSLKK